MKLSEDVSDSTTDKVAITSCFPADGFGEI